MRRWKTETADQSALLLLSLEKKMHVANARSKNFKNSSDSRLEAINESDLDEGDYTNIPRHIDQIGG